MKNNIFKKFIVTGAVALAPVMVNAQSANVSIEGSSNANINDTVTLNVKVNNIEDVNNGIVALGGDIFYDATYLTLVSATPAQSPYNFDGNQINDGNYRIAGVDFTMENGINNDTVVYSFTFKTNKVGNTTVSFKNADLVNDKAENIETTTSSKNIDIKDVITVKEEVVNETTNVVKTVKNINTTNTKEEKVEKIENNIEETVDTTVDTNNENIEQENENENIFTTIFNSIINIFKNIFGFIK